MGVSCSYRAKEQSGHMYNWLPSQVLTAQALFTSIDISKVLNLKSEANPRQLPDYDIGLRIYNKSLS